MVAWSLGGKAGSASFRERFEADPSGRSPYGTSSRGRRDGVVRAPEWSLIGLSTSIVRCELLSRRELCGAGDFERACSRRPHRVFVHSDIIRHPQNRFGPVFVVY